MTAQLFKHVVHVSLLVLSHHHLLALFFQLLQLFMEREQLGGSFGNLQGLLKFGTFDEG